MQKLRISILIEHRKVHRRKGEITKNCCFNQRIDDLEEFLLYLSSRIKEFDCIEGKSLIFKSLSVEHRKYHRRKSGIFQGSVIILIINKLEKYLLYLSSRRKRYKSEQLQRNTRQLYKLLVNGSHTNCDYSNLVSV